LRRVTAVLGLVAATCVAVPAAPVWRDAPELLALFAPVSSRSAAYTMRVTDASLDSVLRELDGDPALVRAPGAWDIRTLAPVDAFGMGGTYDRSKVARLYGAERARVARGARTDGGRVVESWSLISPYPAPSLEKLERGTLLIVLRLP
jgi:hypothetical protein